MMIIHDEIDKMLAPFSYEEIFRECGLRISEIEQLEKDDLLGKISGVGFFRDREYRIEFKKFYDLRYGNVLPSMLESYASSFLSQDHRSDIPVILVARVKKLSESFLKNALGFFGRYDNQIFNWVMIDDRGRLVGHFEGKILDQFLRANSDRKLQPRKHELKQKLSFSPVQQWLLKCLLLNDIDNEMMWPFESHRKIYDYKILSRVSGVSESSCFNFLKLLQDHEYLFIDDYSYRFRNLRQLFDLWEAHYLSARKDEIYLSPIKPMESIGSWRNKAFKLFHKLSSRDGNKIVMSGHLACREIDLSWSNNQSVIFHASFEDDELLEQFAKKMRLRPSESSEDGIKMILHKKDYPVLKVAEGNHEMNIADPIQLLLDVLYQGGRGKEQAEYIYEKLLLKHFRRHEWMN